VVLAAFVVLGVRVLEAQVDQSIDQAQVHVVEIVADKDSRYKSPDGGKPKITLKAREQVLLRVSARKAKSWNRDGSIHGFTLLRAGDRTKVQGWNLLLRPGQQEFQLTAPSEPGEYVVVCTVICSADHEGMNMRLLVAP
jgi:heme/copper-type cytochrome/quinol oxidase subunit 2